MKIRKVSDENLAKAVALLRAAFPGSQDEANLIKDLHDHGKAIHDWVCIHTNRVIAYVGFSNAYRGTEVCGLHLAPLAVNPEFQKQGVGSELLRFALSQEPVKSTTLFVLGRPDFYQRFGFTPCAAPLCPFVTDNAHFLSIRNHSAEPFTVGYEPEFMNKSTGKRSSKPRR